MKKLFLSAAAMSLIGIGCSYADTNAAQSSEATVTFGEIDLNTPGGAIAAARKVQCSLIDNKADHLLLVWACLFTAYGRTR